MLEIFQIQIGEPSEIRKNCIKNIKAFADNNGHKYTLLVREAEAMPYYVQSDILRLEYASTHLNALYVDTDVFLFSLPEFKENKPYFARYKQHRIDTFLFYVNGCCDFFKSLLNDILTNRPDRTRSWLSKTMLKYIEQVSVIENEHFHHLQMRGRP